MENAKQIFLQIFFLKSNRQGFLKDVEVSFSDKTQVSDLTKREFYWMEILRTLYLDDFKGNISSPFNLLHKFIIMFGFPYRLYHCIFLSFAHMFGTCVSYNSSVLVMCWELGLGPLQASETIFGSFNYYLLPQGVISNRL